MAKTTVSVSIVTANYNNGNYLNDFINSIEDSTVAPFELIIIDDGSTDDSVSILDSFSHLNYLKVIKFKKNKGLCEALNTGIEAAQGNYILRVDPDDILIKQRIERQYTYLENNKNIHILGSNAIYFLHETKKEIFNTNFPITHEKIKIKFINGEHGILQGTAMVRKIVFNDHKYKQENVKLEDYDIFSRILISGYNFYNFKEPLLKVRIHKYSLSNNIEFKTIRRVFEIRDKLFNTNSSKLKVRFYYWYILNYRRFLITNNPVYLLLSGLLYPSKLINRFIS